LTLSGWSTINLTMVETASAMPLECSMIKTPIVLVIQDWIEPEDHRTVTSF
jgi:hypothetical protein